MIGRCLCRRVSVRIEEAPAHINICNCDFCRRLGAAWCYFKPGEVTISGETKPFQRDDLSEVWLSAHFCPECGTTTHYEVIHPDGEGVAVNSRLFEQSDLAGIEVRYLDGRKVESEEDDFVRTATGTIGDGSAF